jgi:hypothetical protein
MTMVAGRCACTRLLHWTACYADTCRIRAIIAQAHVSTWYLHTQTHKDTHRDTKTHAHGKNGKQTAHACRRVRALTTKEHTDKRTGHTARAEGTDRLSSTIAEVTGFSMHTLHSGTTTLLAALFFRSERQDFALMLNFFLGPILLTPAGRTGCARACDTQLLAHNIFNTPARGQACWRGTRKLDGTRVSNRIV